MVQNANAGEMEHKMDEWKCKHCTISNHALLEFCECCGLHKVTNKPFVFRQDAMMNEGMNESSTNDTASFILDISEDDRNIVKNAEEDQGRMDVDDDDHKEAMTAQKCTNCKVFYGAFNGHCSQCK